MKTLDENPDVKAMLENIATNIRAFLATGDRSRWDPNTPMKPAYELQMAWAIANGRKDYLTCNSTGKLTNVAQIRAYLNGRVAGPPECSGTSAGASDDKWECVAYMLPPLPSVAPAAPAAPVAAPVAEVAPAPRVAALEAEIAALRAENATLKTTLKALL
jgi:hypothetical protein